MALCKYYGNGMSDSQRYPYQTFFLSNNDREIFYYF